MKRLWSTSGQQFFKKPTKNERRQFKRKHAREVTYALKEQWAKTDIDSVLQGRQSYSSWERATYRQSLGSPAKRRKDTKKEKQSVPKATRQLPKTGTLMPFFRQL